MTQTCNFCHGLKVKVSSYIAQYPIFRIAQSAFYTLLPGRPVQSKTISASLGSIQPRGNFAKTACTQIFITVYSQVLIHTAELTGAMLCEKTCPRFHMAAQDLNLGPLI